MFASDFPHEISMDNYYGDDREILERHDREEDNKAAILGANPRAI